MFRFNKIGIWLLKTIVKVSKIVILTLLEVVKVITTWNLRRVRFRYC
jgi:hypothetical protein